MVGSQAEHRMRRQHQYCEGDEGQQIGHGTGPESVSTKAWTILHDVAVAVAGTQADQNKNTAGDRREGIDAQQQEHQMIMKILFGCSHYR